MLRPVNTRRRIAAAQSKTGSVKAATDAASRIVPGPLSEPAMLMVPTMRPMSMLPASPRKIVAGGKLKRRNPTRHAAKTAATRATSGGRPTSTAIPQIVADRIMPTVVASPSAPSSRFNAFTAPSNQNSVNGIAQTPRMMCRLNKLMVSITTPPAMRIAAASNWPISF